MGLIWGIIRIIHNIIQVGVHEYLGSLEYYLLTFYTKDHDPGAPKPLDKSLATRRKFSVFGMMMLALSIFSTVFSALVGQNSQHLGINASICC